MVMGVGELLELRMIFHVCMIHGKIHQLCYAILSYPIQAETPLLTLSGVQRKERRR